MFAYRCECIAALIYLTGYGLVAVLSYIHEDHHCTAYCLITLAALIHFVVVLLGKRPKHDG